MSSEDVRTEVRDHQRLAEEARAEMRDDDRHRRVRERDGVQVQGVAEADVERARQAELDARADREHAAVDEHGRAGPGRAGIEQLPHALVLEGVAVHRGEEARDTKAAIERAGRADNGLGRGRVDHEHPDESGGVTVHGRFDRRLVAGHARHDGGAADAVTIELGHPPIGERLRRARRVPPELRQRGVVRRVRVRALQPAPERGEERGGEEVTVSVVQHDGEERQTQNAKRKTENGKRKTRTFKRGHKMPRPGSDGCQELRTTERSGAKGGALVSARILIALFAWTDRRSTSAPCDSPVGSSNCIRSSRRQEAPRETKPDFITKVCISLKESREAVFWLRAIHESRLLADDDIEPDIREAREFVAMLTATVKRARTSTNRG